MTTTTSHPMGTLLDTPQIPLELQKDIIDCCFADYRSYLHYDIPHTMLPLLLVCKSWNAYATPHLYRQVYLERFSVYLDFSAATRNPERAESVRQLSFNLLKGERSITHLFKSKVIEVILSNCRCIETIEYVVDWDVTESIPVMTSLATYLRDLAKPITLKWTGQWGASSLYFFSSLLPVTSTRPKVKGFACRLAPHSLKMARRIQLAAELQRLVFFVDFYPDNNDHIQYDSSTDSDSDDADLFSGPVVPEEGAEFREKTLRPWEFFSIVSQHPKLLSMKIYSVPRLSPKRHTEGQAEIDILNWIGSDPFIQSRVSFQIADVTVDELDARRPPKRYPAYSSGW